MKRGHGNEHGHAVVVDGGGGSGMATSLVPGL